MRSGVVTLRQNILRGGLIVVFLIMFEGIAAVPFWQYLLRLLLIEWQMHNLAKMS